MLRDTGLHAGLAFAALAVLGAILQYVAIGMALGLLAAALVTWRWPVRDDMAAVDGRFGDDGTPGDDHGA